METTQLATAGEGINWSVHTIEYYYRLRRNNILTQVTIQMNLENIMLSEIGQTHKTNTQYNSTYVRGLEDSVLETERRVLVYRVQSFNFTR